MEKKILLKDLVSTGTHIRTEVTDQLQAPHVDEDDENVIWGGV